MPFIDWNGNGEIDPADIGISIATENDEDVDDAPTAEKGNIKHGCLNSAMLFLCVIAVAILAIGAACAV